MDDLSVRFIAVCDDLLSKKEVSNLTDFASKIGISTGMLTDIRKGRTRPGADAIRGIARTFPQYNLHWLLLGEGEMNAIDSSSHSVVAEPDIDYGSKYSKSKFIQLLTRLRDEKDPVQKGHIYDAILALNGKLEDELTELKDYMMEVATNLSKIK